MKLFRSLQPFLTFLVVFVLLFMSACSMRVTYNYLDWIIPYYMDDYVTLTDKQEKFFDHTTIQFLDWHRTEELPRYENYIVGLKESQTAPMSRQQVLQFFGDAEALWTSLLSESMPSLLGLSTQLSEKQLKEINDALKDDIKELQNKYGKQNDIQRREFWREKMYDVVDDWLGRVTDDQSEIIRLWSETRKNTTDSWLAYRNNWRKVFIELLNRRHSANFKDDMTIFLLNPQRFYQRAYRLDVSENRRHFAQVIADLSTTFIPQQRQHLQHALDRIIGDLKELRDQ
jgi:hypothetical protein